MAAGDDHGAGKPVSLLSQAIAEARAAGSSHRPASPVGPEPHQPIGRRPRSHTIYNASMRSAVEEKRARSVAAHQQELDRRLGQPLKPLLHKTESEAARANIAEKGLLPLSHPQNPSTRVAYGGMGGVGSTHDPSAIYAGGPNVMGQYFPEQTENYVHVIGKEGGSGFAMPDMDYHRLLGIGNNDAFVHHGAAKPVREAELGDTDPVSFTVPMSPRSRAGLSRYLTGSEAHQQQAHASVKRQFQARFDPLNQRFGSSYQFPDLDEQAARRASVSSASSSSSLDDAAARSAVRGGSSAAADTADLGEAADVVADAAEVGAMAL